MTLPFPSCDQIVWIYFLNFLHNPARPSNPEPRRSMVVGSGTGVVSVKVVPAETSVMVVKKPVVRSATSAESLTT